MPKIWADTVDQHRSEVRDAILEATGELATEVGERALTMSEIAARAGIGRATLYKYFGDIESILAAWHQRMISLHLAHLRDVIANEDDPQRRLVAAATRHAETIHQHHHASAIILRPASSSEQATTVADGKNQLIELFTELATAAQAEQPESIPLPPAEFANYLIHALAAAATAESKASLRRLVSLTLGMRGQSG